MNIDFLFKFLDQSQEMIHKDGNGVRKTWRRAFLVARDVILGSSASAGASRSLITHLLSGLASFLCSVVWDSADIWSPLMARCLGSMTKVARVYYTKESCCKVSGGETLSLVDPSKH